MKREMQLVGLIVAALIVAFLTTYYLPTHLSTPNPFTPRPNMPIPGDIELFYTIKTVISTANTTLLIFLLLSYLDLYRKIKSDFTIALIIFSTVLLLYALTSNPIVQLMFGFRAFGLGPFAVIPDFFSCIAVIILLYLNFKY